MATIPTPPSSQPDELTKIESTAAEVTGLAGIIMSGVRMFSMLRKQKVASQTPPPGGQSVPPGANANIAPAAGQMPSASTTPASSSIAKPTPPTVEDTTKTS